MKFASAISELALSSRIDVSNLVAITGRGGTLTDEQAGECDRLRKLAQEKLEAIALLRAADAAKPEATPS